MTVDGEVGAYVRRKTCRACNGKNLYSFLDFGRLPLAGDFRLKEELGSTRTYPMDLVVCRDCSLVQILNVVAPEILFGNYRYLSSVTQTLSRHFREYALLLKQQMPPDSSAYVFEFGCNDGVLLQPLTEQGVKAIGIDAAPNVVEIARQRGLNVINGLFCRETARKTLGTEGPAHVITASNVFAHIDDLDEVMAAVDILLESGGRFIVEVHYVMDMISGFQFDTVYHEHLCYFSLHSLRALYERHGFSIVDVFRLPMHGGAIRVVAQRSSEASVVSDEVPRCIEREVEAGILTGTLYDEFAKGVHRYRRELVELIHEIRKKRKEIAAFGAAGRATVLLNYCGLGGDSLNYVVDESAFRIGRYVPGVNIPIVSRDYFHDNYPDYCLITAWNYRDEVISKELNFVRGGGAFIVPLPKIEFVHERS